MTQGKITSNIGQTGVESIRIGGMLPADLPIAESAQAKEQMPLAEEDAKKQLVKNIKARYPPQDVEYLRSRIREARGNIAKFQEQRNRIASSREEYRMLLHDVKKRDKRIRKAEEELGGDALEAEIKAATAEYGPWQRVGLERQLGQFGESIQRFEDVVKVEQKAIDELTELLGQCRARDKELVHLGA